MTQTHESFLRDRTQYHLMRVNVSERGSRGKADKAPKKYNRTRASRYARVLARKDANVRRSSRGRFLTVDDLQKGVAQW